MQVCGNLRQPQWAIKQMGNLVMPIKSGGREGKNRKMKQNVILMHETLLTTILSNIRPKSASRLSFVTISTSAIASIIATSNKEFWDCKRTFFYVKMCLSKVNRTRKVIREFPFNAYH